MRSLFFLAIATAALLGADFTIKFWKVPGLDVADFNSDQRELEVFKKWSEDDHAPIRFISNIKDSSGVNEFSFGNELACDDNALETQTKAVRKWCLVLDVPGREFDSARYMFNSDQPYDQIYNGDYPTVYTFDGKFTVIFVDLTSEYYPDDVGGDLKVKIRTFDRLIKHVANETHIKLDSIFIIGNLGAPKKVLQDILKYTDLDAYGSKEDFLDGKKTVNSQNVIATKNNPYVKDVVVRDDLYDIKAKAGQVSQYYPIELKLHYPLERTLVYW